MLTVRQRSLGSENIQRNRNELTVTAIFNRFTQGTRVTAFAHALFLFGLINLKRGECMSRCASFLSFLPPPSNLTRQMPPFWQFRLHRGLDGLEWNGAEMNFALWEKSDRVIREKMAYVGFHSIGPCNEVDTRIVLHDWSSLCKHFDVDMVSFHMDFSLKDVLRHAWYCSMQAGVPPCVLLSTTFELYLRKCAMCSISAWTREICS